jgi:hypothetical protein
MKKIFALFFLLITNQCFGQTATLPLNRDSIVQDSLLNVEFFNFSKAMTGLKEDDVIDTNARYKLLFSASCPFTEIIGVPETYTITISKDSLNGDSMTFANPPKYYCSDNIRRTNDIVDSLDALRISFWGIARITSYGNKYVVVESEKSYSYVGNQTSWGFYITYYLEKL